MDTLAAAPRRSRAGLDVDWAETTARLRAFIARRVASPQLADDLTQDVLTRSLASGFLDTVDNPTGWLYRAARNAVIDHYRLRRQHQPLTDVDERWSEPDTGDSGPNDATRELARCLQPLVDQLPAIYCDALTRVDLHGDTHRDAAAATGISVSGMKSRVQRGRHQLRDLLTDCCAVSIDSTGAIDSYRADELRCASHCHTPVHREPSADRPLRRAFVRRADVRSAR